MDYIEQSLYNFIDESKLKFDYLIVEQNNITNLLRNLCDQSKNSFYNLTEKETIILRGILHIYYLPNFEKCKPGIVFSVEDLSKIYDSIRYIKLKINYIIRYGYVYSRFDKMCSSFPKECEDFYINKIGLNQLEQEILVRNNIYSLRDLLSHSKQDLLMLRGFSSSKVYNIELLLSKYKLQFIDCLSDLDRKRIILNSDENEILNSSIYWIKGITKKFVKSIGCTNNCRIIDLVNYIKSDHNVDESIIKYAMSIGIDLKNGKKYNFDINVKIDDLDLDEQIKIRFIINGISTIGDIILLDKHGLQKILENNNFLVNGIINLVHNMGLQFSYEINQTEKKIK